MIDWNEGSETKSNKCVNSLYYTFHVISNGVASDCVNGIRVGVNKTKENGLTVYFEIENV